MAHKQSTCNHLTLTMYIDYATRIVSEFANCNNCLATIKIENSANKKIKKEDFSI